MIGPAIGPQGGIRAAGKSLLPSGAFRPASSGAAMVVAGPRFS